MRHVADMSLDLAESDIVDFINIQHTLTEKERRRAINKLLRLKNLINESLKFLREDTDGE